MGGKRTKADRRNELMELERKDAKGFWLSVTPQDAALLVSDTRPGNWPVFTVDGWGANMSRLHLAVGNRNGEVVRLLLEKDADTEAREDDQWTPLHRAARWGNDEVARLLLERGADVNAREEDQSTPLHIAAWHGQDEVARVLLERGADIHARDNKGNTALDDAKGRSKTGVVALLRAKLRQAGRR